MEHSKNIVRVEKNKDYTIINNTSLYDDRLSWKAKAIHVFMLSKPDDWTFHNIEMMKWANEGEHAFASGLKELKRYGYVKKERRRNKGGKFDWVTVVYEVPQEVKESEQPVESVHPSPDLPCTENQGMAQPYPEKPSVEKPRVDNPSTEKPSVENHELLSTDIPSTELLSTNKLSTEFKNINNNDDEAKASPAPARPQENAFAFYQANGFGVLSGYVTEKVGAWVDDVGDDLVVHAMKLAIENNAIKWSYVETILRGWSQKQITTIEQVEAEKLRFAAEKNKQQTQRRRPGNYGRKVEVVPKWMHKEQNPSAALEVPTPLNNENTDIDAEYQELLKQFRGLS
ncbi:DnaD domain protein [Metasolibacillus sp.]|uniref:DnaD domain-containing protein n=2 Tax=Metasolibacillus sp. TaxID=2703680 RepID=UPI0025DB5835|nr:DnaD domain protein [Metasolibacillus sp.]MCT6925285.1 DnaD domain protein [Metasolibacillus sp.]